MSRALAVLAVLVPFAALAAQDGAREAATDAPVQQPLLRTGTTAVVLDVIVRDRRAQPVRDIQPSEVTVLEDGVRRDVRSFRLIERTGAGEAEPEVIASESSDAIRHPALVTLVFDHLTQNARALARRAAVQLVARELPPNQWVAVYGLEQRLRLAQPFTRDIAALRAAIDRATAAPAETRDRLAAGQADEAGASRAADAALAATAAERPSVDAAAVGAAVSEARVAEVIARMTRMVEAADVQARGQATLFPLMALLKAQGSLAGRKALVLFSEGLSVPPNLEDAYRTAISEANRANVSLYAVDARGLDTGRALEQSRQMLDRSARNSQAQLVAGRSQRPVTLDDVMNSESAEGALRSDAQTSLRALAEETGGALVANTNDLGPVLASRVRTDLDSYYEIGYTAGSAAADGRFRRIEVKIARRGITVHSRSGYFALPETDTAPLLPYELPMLAAAAANPPARAFEYAAGAFRFGSSPGGIQHTVVLEVPLEQLTFVEDPQRRTYALRFTAMALVKNASGEVVQRLSESYPLEGPIARVPALKRGRLRFKRQLWLPPGRYTLSLVARDQATERSSVRTLPIEVAAGRQGIGISDLTIIRSIEQADAGDRVEDPFRTGTMRVVPNLGLPISKAANPQVSAYVTLYPEGTAASPTLTFEFTRDGAVVGRSAAELPKPDEAGRIKYVASFPTSVFQPGTYGVRAIASQGASGATAEAPFTLIP